MFERSRSCSEPSGTSSRASFSSIRAPCRHSQAPHFSSRTKGCKAFQVFAINGRSALIRFLSTLRMLLADPELAEDILHETPPRQGGLEKVRADEGGEQEPVCAVNLAEGQTHEDECSGNQSNPAFERHGSPP